MKEHFTEGGQTATHVHETSSKLCKHGAPYNINQSSKQSL